MILDSRFWILDCGLKQHESHCRKRLRGERGSSSIAFMSALTEVKVTATKSGESDLENPARPSRNRMTARVNDERRNFGASYNFRARQALGNLRTARRF